jgi:CubicO group peptidase (beta-lactamase class C family)
MRHQRALLAICSVFLIVSACAPASPPKVTPSSASSAGSVAPSAGTSPSSSAISPDAISAVDAMLANMTSQSVFSGSVLIAQHAHVLLSKGYGFADSAQKTPNGPQTRFSIGSNTKQFTAAAILLLEVQGKLKVTDRICAYIPQCPSAWSVITIKELLTHTSGIPDYLNTVPDFAAYAGPPLTPLQIIAHFRDLPLEFAPGTTWRYSNSGYFLLGYIIEQVSGLSYEAFLQKNILTPLNLRDTGYNHNSNGVAIGYNLGGGLTPVEPVDPSLPYAAGALYSTVEDMNRWEQALTTDALLPTASRAEMFAIQMAITDPAAPPMYAGYGYGFFIGTDSGRPIIWHGGAVPGFLSIEARYPVDDVTVIILGNQMILVEMILGYVSAKLFKGE